MNVTVDWTPKIDLKDIKGIVIHLSLYTSYDRLNTIYKNFIFAVDTE